ncbi:MAG TPA: TadE/TadG family type IV pilus assembly protein [Nitrospiraceae bacterium]|nr:TadE/TadG family type IV pilus assembly protein [Nitrospiraceae bacterium]
MNKTMRAIIKPLNNSRGATAVMVALMLTVLLAMGAAAIDIGHALVARNELQNVSDAAALAGTRALGIIYEGMTIPAQQSYVLTSGDQATIVAAVQATANANSAAGVFITIAPSDIAIGTWNPATRTHTPTANQPKAVRVISRRDASTNGTISTFLANVVGLSSVSVSAVATADMSAVGQTAPGQLNVPFGISEFYFSQFGCGDVIQFYPSNGTPQSCAGFTTFDQAPSNDITMRNIINGMADGTYTTPGTQAGMTSLQFTNGTLSNPTWNALINLFNTNKDAGGGWDVFVPVYQGADCSPSGPLPIVGYAEARVTNVQGQPNAQIVATVQCNMFEGNTVGGGPPYGPVLSTIPGLVE